MQQADCDWASTIVEHIIGRLFTPQGSIPFRAQVKQMSGRTYHSDRVASGAAEDKIMVTRASAPHKVAASSISPFRRFCTWIKLDSSLAA